MIGELGGVLSGVEVVGIQCALYTLLQTPSPNSMRRPRSSRLGSRSSVKRIGVVMLRLINVVERSSLGSDNGVVMRPLPSLPIGVTGGVRFELEVEVCEIPLPLPQVCSDNCIGELGGVMPGMMGGYGPKWNYGRW